MEDRKYTIKDIARMAGVSAGTVDRVMHERGEVSEASRAKVQRVLDEINYRPNVFAIGLAAKKKYTLACLIPSHSADDYWAEVGEGIDRAADELQAFGVGVRLFTYEQDSAPSYAESQRQLLEAGPDAVLVAPNFRDDTRRFVARLDERAIPYAFVDVNPEQTHAVQYIGQDSHQSGYVAAKMLMQAYDPSCELILFLGNSREHPSAFQMQRRLEGFMRYLDERQLHPVIHEVVFHRDDPSRTEASLDDFFSTHRGRYLGVVFSSRIYQVGRYLAERRQPMVSLAGYDLLPANVDLLRSGVVSFLIGQRPRLQGYCGVKVLADRVVFKKEVPPLHHMPIDILIRDNIDYYAEIV